MDGYVLDTFALMAYFQDEQSSDKIEALLTQALDKQIALCISQISAGELFYMTHRKHDAARANAVWADLQEMPLAMYPATQARILAAARIKATHRVSYADAFAIALAQELGCKIVTGAPEFKEVEALVPVMWLT